MAQDNVYRVAETCPYGSPASMEIVCDRNYMEVSRGWKGPLTKYASECTMTFVECMCVLLWLHVSLKAGTHTAEVKMDALSLPDVRDEGRSR